MNKTYKQRKAERLQRAMDEVDDGKWTKHSEFQWSRMVPTSGPYKARLDYWPSTDRYRYDDMEHEPSTQPGAFKYIKSLGIGK